MRKGLGTTTVQVNVRRHEDEDDPRLCIVEVPPSIATPSREFKDMEGDRISHRHRSGLRRLPVIHAYTHSLSLTHMS